MISTQRTNIDVLGVVVGESFVSIDPLGHARPLRSVACAFEETRQAADGHLQTVAAGDVSHAASEAHGIGADDPLTAALVGE